jgi:hypothetical protein
LRTKRIVLEATGGYEGAQWLALSEAGLVAAVVNHGTCASLLATPDGWTRPIGWTRLIAHFAEMFYAAAGLLARAERRLALLRAERQEIEREMRAIVDRHPRKGCLPA